MSYDNMSPIRESEAPQAAANGTVIAEQQPEMKSIPPQVKDFLKMRELAETSAQAVDDKTADALYDVKDKFSPETTASVSTKNEIVEKSQPETGVYAFTREEIVEKLTVPRKISKKTAEFIADTIIEFKEVRASMTLQEREDFFPLQTAADFMEFSHIGIKKANLIIEKLGLNEQHAALTVNPPEDFSYDPDDTEIAGPEHATALNSSPLAIGTPESKTIDVKDYTVAGVVGENQNLWRNDLEDTDSSRRPKYGSLLNRISEAVKNNKRILDVTKSAKFEEIPPAPTIPVEATLDAEEAPQTELDEAIAMLKREGGNPEKVKQILAILKGTQSIPVGLSETPSVVTAAVADTAPTLSVTSPPDNSRTILDNPWIVAPTTQPGSTVSTAASSWEPALVTQRQPIAAPILDASARANPLAPEQPLLTQDQTEAPATAEQKTILARAKEAIAKLPLSEGKKTWLFKNVTNFTLGASAALLSGFMVGAALHNYINQAPVETPVPTSESTPGTAVSADAPTLPEITPDATASVIATPVVTPTITAEASEQIDQEKLVAPEKKWWQFWRGDTDSSQSGIEAMKEVQDKKDAIEFMRDLGAPSVSAAEMNRTATEKYLAQGNIGDSDAIRFSDGIVSPSETVIEQKPEEQALSKIDQSLWLEIAQFTGNIPTINAIKNYIFAANALAGKHPDWNTIQKNNSLAMYESATDLTNVSSDVVAFGIPDRLIRSFTAAFESTEQPDPSDADAVKAKEIMARLADGEKELSPEELETVRRYISR